MMRRLLHAAFVLTILGAPILLPGQEGEPARHMTISVGGATQRRPGQLRAISIMEATSNSTAATSLTGTSESPELFSLATEGSRDQRSMP